MNHLTRRYWGVVLLFSISCLTARAQQVKYTTGNNEWDADSLGNHRAVVHFDGAGTTARVVIPWRLRDMQPHQRIIVQDAATRQLVTAVYVRSLDREQGDIQFIPTSGKGTYYVYYLPYKNEGRSNYPKGVYLQADNGVNSELPGKLPAPNVTVQALQSIDTFNTFYPMEVIATAAEVKRLRARYPSAPFLVFPEDRLHAIRMTDDLPQRWIQSGPGRRFTGKADKGEYFAWQLGLYALQGLQQVRVQFSDLRSAAGQVIPASRMSCINTDGTTYEATPLKKEVSVATDKIQAMWCGVDVPKEQAAGVYKGTAIIHAAGVSAVPVQVEITITDKLAVNGGADEPWKQTRLKWLNSTLAQENTVIAPYTPLVVQDRTIQLLGRRVTLGADGLPAQIQTYFTPEMTSLSATPRALLQQPIRLDVWTTGGSRPLDWQNTRWAFTGQQPGKVSWQAERKGQGLQMQLEASLEFDGYMIYTMRLIAEEPVSVKDIALQIPMEATVAQYMMGLNHKGGARPNTVDWKWDVAHKNQDGAWVGDVNGGLQFSLRDQHYSRPLNTNFYLQKPLLLPVSWGNGNKGGVTMKEENGGWLIRSYSGERTLQRGDTLYFNFHLIITPFHPINTDFQWANRFYHKYDNLDTIKRTGATVINIHHANPINPWINYPFIEHARMKTYIDEAHRKGLKVKIYNTVRELSNRAYETFALRSLGHEVYTTGPGGGYAWLQEHVGKDYIAAWFVPEIKDAAIVNSGMNRWHNYYVEGMNWLVDHVGIDGIYLDDVAFDRVTMKRIKRVLTKAGHPGIIDLHSANQYNKHDGFMNSALLYMEHFPYLNRLWFGEYFDYEQNDPDFFLTEVSGIPFGLMGEMLQDGGNPWRGMIYGMTSRLPWSETADPRNIWKLWDDFGMQGSQMVGYWVKDNPVKSSDPKVPVTIYRKAGAVLVSIASWAATDTSVKLQIDWKALGIDPAKVVIKAPEIRNFQEGRVFDKDAAIPVAKNKGWLLVIQ